MSNETSSFDEPTKQRIKSLFTEKFKQKHPTEAEEWLDFEAKVFISILQNFGESVPEFKKFYPPKQQKRRETIKSMGSALLRCLNQFEALDSGARGFVYFRGIDEISNTIGEPKLFPAGVRNSLWVHSYKDDAIEELRAFAKGVLKAADELPENPSPPIQLRMALFIEGLFYDYDFDFTTSQTSFAAECLRAVLAKGGIQKDRVDYWLTEARNHPESMTAFKNRNSFKGTRQKTDEKNS
ncbi:MAG: hypothetical protein ACXWTU_03820 [Methylotenera sp.]